jgi:glycosyltransferase involved in cell wall biosynthesis
MEKMIVTYQAPFDSSQFLVHSSQCDISKFGVNKKYVLYVGSAYPHKNLENLIRAWQIFTDKHDNDYQLVLVGKDSYFYDRLVNDPLPNPPLLRGGNVVYAGFVPDDELVRIIKKRFTLCFPVYMKVLVCHL